MKEDSQAQHAQPTEAPTERLQLTGAVMTVRDVAALWGVSDKTVWRLIERLELGCVRIGPGRRTVRVLSVHRDEYLKKVETLPYDAKQHAKRTIKAQS